MKEKRSFWNGLWFEKDGDFNPGYALTGLVIMSLIFGFVWVIVAKYSITVQIVSFSSLITALGIISIVAVPLGKAKVLANAKMPSEVGKAVIPDNIETSTDVRELSGN